MILTVTLNPAVDFTVYGDTFKVNETNRGRLMDPDPGGKGNNVARVARLLGTDVVATGFLGGFTGRFIESGLREEGIETDFLHIDSLSRITVAYIEETASAETKVVPFGPDITRSEREKFARHYRSLLKENSFSSVILSGSLPGSLPDDYYGTLIDSAREYDVRVLLDTSGPPLVCGMKHTPFLVKPNRQEAKELVGSDGERETYRFFEGVAENGTIVALTLGEGGAVFFSGNKIYRIRPEAGKGRNPVGAGDAFVGGLACALDRFGKRDDMLFSWAAAAGTAAAGSQGLLFSTDLFHEIQKSLLIENISDIV
jgi:tagatose 6-phosphate kinase